jgi:metal-sulfur cluster biosynthetic enzyme
MTEIETLKQALLDNLVKVIDPETGADVVRMRLVQDLSVTEGGEVSYIFRPSSFVCPIALTLVMEIIEAVKATPGVSHQQVTVVDYAGAEELNKILASLNL